MTLSISSIKNVFQNAISQAERVSAPVTEFVRSNPLLSASAIGVSTAGLTAGGIAAVRKVTTRKKSTKKRKTTTTKRRKTKKRTTRRKTRGRRTPRTAGKGRDRSTKRIRYTKKGQPYVITRSGKAKFIKKSSAKRSHKLKGGKY